MKLLLTLMGITVMLQLATSHEAAAQTQRFNVASSSTGNGVVSPLSQTQPDTVLPSGTVLEVEASGFAHFRFNPDVGFEVDTVTDTCLPQGTSATMDPAKRSYLTGPINADCSVEVTFAPLPVGFFTVSPVAGVNGRVEPSYRVTVQQNQTTQFDVYPDEGYEIFSVGGTCGVSSKGNPVVTPPVTDDCTVEVTFTAAVQDSCSINVSAGLGGRTKPSEGVWVVGCPGGQVFGAIPDAGFEFDRWDGTCEVNGSGPSAQIWNPSTTSAVCNVTASFSQITHTVSPNATAGGSISPSNPQTVNDGDQAFFTITPEFGYKIESVTGDCGGAFSGTGYLTDQVDDDCSVLANFVQLDELLVVDDTKLALDFDAGSTCELVPGSAKSSALVAPVSAVTSLIGTQVEFKLDNCSTTETVKVSVDFGQPLPQGAQAYKVVGDKWTLIDGAIISGTSISYEIEDNGLLDANPAVGKVDDPVTVAVPVAISHKPVPALPLFGLLTLGGLVGLFGIRKLKKSHMPHFDV